MLYGGDPMPNFTHRDMPNPLVGTYKTKDDRYITLMMLQGDKFYPEFVTVIGRDDLIEDKRFADGHSRFENRGELIDILDDEFAARTVDQWRGILKPLSGAWSVLQKSSELRDDPAVVANGYIPTVNAMNGARTSCRPTRSNSTSTMSSRRVRQNMASTPRKFCSRLVLIGRRSSNTTGRIGALITPLESQVFANRATMGERLCGVAPYGVTK